MNTPYVKKYDKNGEVSNPIIGHYPSLGPNRKMRRLDKNRPRLMNNRKPTAGRRIQLIPLFRRSLTGIKYLIGWRTVQHRI